MVPAKPSEPEILHQTLVRDRLVPSGFSEKFVAFYGVVNPAADRQYKHLAKITNASAAVTLHQRRSDKAAVHQASQLATDQLLKASLKQPLKFKSRLERSSAAGPNSPKGFRSDRKNWMARTPWPN